MTLNPTVANNLTDTKANLRTNPTIDNSLGASANIGIQQLSNPPAVVNFVDLDRNGPFNPAANKTYVLIHGWNTSINATDSWVPRIANTLNNVDRSANIIAVDWAENGAQGLYNRAVDDMPQVGRELAAHLAAIGANPATTQIIGHSLGAHIAGIAADEYDRLNPGVIDSVIGLDPAGPLINTNDLANRLDATDANRVSAIHTDQNPFGYYDRLGDFDFFVNQGANQPNGNDHAYAHVLYDQLISGLSFQQDQFSAVGPTFDINDVNGVLLTEGGYNVTTLL